MSIYDIAQPSDLLGQNECIIGSQVTDNASLVGLCMEAVEDGSFGGEVIYGTLQNGALSAGALSDLVPADVQEKYRATWTRWWTAALCSKIYTPQTTAAPSRCLDGAAFPPCPGNFCPTVERGLQCRALDGGQPLPSSLARRRKTAVRSKIARPFFRYSAPQERRGPPCSSGHQEREALSSRQSSGFFVWFL